MTRAAGARGLDARGDMDAGATAALRAAMRGPVRMFHRTGYVGPLVRRPAERV